MKLFMDGTKLNRHLEDVVNWQKGNDVNPIHLELSLANVCNQACEFCYISWSHGKDILEKETALNLVRDAKKVGVKSVLIAGEGEPTLSPHWVDVLAEFGKQNIDVALNTNLVKIKETEIPLICDTLSWLRISFQSSNPERYAEIHRCQQSHYERVVTNIKKIVEYKKVNNSKLAIGMQQVLLPSNGQDIYDNARLAKDLGVDYYVIKPCHPHELNDDKEDYKTLVDRFSEQLQAAEKLTTDTFKAVIRWDFLKESLKKREYRTCHALPFIVQISANGNVNSCFPRSHQSKNVYGNLYKQSFHKMIEGSFQGQWRTLSKEINVHECMPLCRHHNANKYLDWLQNSPDHLNFI